MANPGIACKMTLNYCTLLIRNYEFDISWGGIFKLGSMQFDVEANTTTLDRMGRIGLWLQNIKGRILLLQLRTWIDWQVFRSWSYSLAKERSRSFNWPFLLEEAHILRTRRRRLFLRDHIPCIFCRGQPYDTQLGNFNPKRHGAAVAFCLP